MLDATEAFGEGFLELFDFALLPMVTAGGSEVANGVIEASEIAIDLKTGMPLPKALEKFLIGHLVGKIFD